MVDIIFQAINVLGTMLIHGSLEVFLYIATFFIFPKNQDEIFRLEDDDEEKR